MYGRMRRLAFSTFVAVLLGGAQAAIVLADGSRIEVTPAFDGPVGETDASRAALHAMATEEDAFAQTMAVTTHIVTARVAGDEEYRAIYGSTQWDNEAQARLEAADNQFYTNWGIDIIVMNFHNWDSNDGTNGCGTLLGEVQQEHPHDGRDIVVGFTNQPTGIGGCSETPGNAFIIDYQSATADWKVAQHEFSHLYGAEDASGPVHPNDVMENPYNFPNTWCTYLNGPGWDHFGVIGLASDRFD